MPDIINNLLFLSLLLPPLIMTGSWFLLAWALNRPQKNIFAGFGVTLGFVFLAALLFGKPAWPLGFGRDAILVALLIMGVLSLLNALSLKNIYIEAVIGLSVIWVLLGLPMETILVMAIIASIGFYMVGVVGLLFKTALTEDDLQTTFNTLILLVLWITGILYAVLSGHEKLVAFSSGGMVLLVILKILSFLKRDLQLYQNALSPFIIALVFVFWSLWFEANVPLISLLCLILAPGARTVTLKLFSKGDQEPTKIAAGMILIGISLLPILLSVVFFYIFKLP